MKRFSIFCAFLAVGVSALAGCTSSTEGGRPAAAPVEIAPGPQLYNELLGEYVEGDYFAYGRLLASDEDMAKFEAFLQWQAEADLEAMSREEQIAFYINAYNSCCLKAVLDHYPVHTPLDVDGFFDELKFTVAGEELTVSEIEYERLIANYQDMRAHFAVVCADRGCLPLKANAYTGVALDADLESAAQRFVSDPRHFSVDQENRVVNISKIFEWYGEKFLSDPMRPVDGDRPELFLTPWVDDETRALLESNDYELMIIEWAWTLNEKSGA